MIAAASSFSCSVAIPLFGAEREREQERDCNSYLGTQLLDGRCVGHLNAPTVQTDCGCSLYLLHQFGNVLALVAAAPAQAACQVVARAQWYHPNGGLCDQLNGVCKSVCVCVCYNSVAYMSVWATHLPIASSTQPTVPSPPQQITLKLGKSLKSVSPAAREGQGKGGERE